MADNKADKATDKTSKAADKTSKAADKTSKEAENSNLTPFEDLVRQAQETALAGARGLQEAYRSIIHSPLIKETESQLKDPKHAMVGAGFGAGVGLGLSLLLRVHPIGRVIMVIAGASTGALIAAKKQPEKGRLISKTRDQEKPESNPKANTETI